MKDWLIIDGYNLLHQLSTGVLKDDLARLRKNLLATLEPLVNILARRITVVFDGQFAETPDNQKDQASPKRFAQARSEIIEVIYAPPDSTADGVIEKLVWKAEQPENILVVTSDRLVRDAVSAVGADTMASSIFISMINEQSKYLSARIEKINKRRENVTLGDFFPKQKTD